jgi:KaiC/GvpD/RAD55 family RecA-like ATPase
VSAPAAVRVPVSRDETGAEAHLVGLALLCEGEGLADVAGIVAPADLLDLNLRRTWAAVLDLHRAAQPVNISTVAAASGLSPVYIAALPRDVPLDVPLRHLAEEVHRQALLRRAVADADALRRELAGMVAGEHAGASETLAVAGRVYDALVAVASGHSEGVPAAWRPVMLAALCPGGAPVEWAWDGYLARGYVTCLVGVWKAGKSTFLSHLLRSLGREFCGRATADARALVVSEEAADLWARRRDDIGIPGDRVLLVARPFLGRPALDEWLRFLAHVVNVVRREHLDLVVFDAMPNLWPVADENSAAEVAAAVRPISAIAQAGAAVLLTHHPAKAEYTEGRASRGSGWLPGYADVVIEMRREDPSSALDTRRRLVAFSRFEETPRELVVDLTPRGYVALGSPRTARLRGARDAILALLRAEPLGQGDLESALRGEGFGRDVVRREVEALEREGVVSRRRLGRQAVWHVNGHRLPQGEEPGYE